MSAIASVETVSSVDTLSGLYPVPAHNTGDRSLLIEVVAPGGWFGLDSVAMHDDFVPMFDAGAVQYQLIAGARLDCIRETGAVVGGGTIDLPRAMTIMEACLAVAHSIAAECDGARYTGAPVSLIAHSYGARLAAWSA